MGLFCIRHNLNRRAHFNFLKNEVGSRITEVLQSTRNEKGNRQLQNMQFSAIFCMKAEKKIEAKIFLIKFFEIENNPSRKF